MTEEAKTAIARCAAIYVLSLTSTAQSSYKTNDLDSQMIIETAVNMGFDEMRQHLEGFRSELIFELIFNYLSLNCCLDYNKKIKRLKNRKSCHKKSVEPNKPIYSSETGNDVTLTQCKIEIKSESNQSLNPIKVNP